MFNSGLPKLKLISVGDTGTVIDEDEGHFGHNALFKRQNEMLNMDGVDHVKIYRVYVDEKRG